MEKRKEKERKKAEAKMQKCVKLKTVVEQYTLCDSIGSSWRVWFSGLTVLHKVNADKQAPAPEIE